MTRINQFKQESQRSNLCMKRETKKNPLQNHITGIIHVQTTIATYITVIQRRDTTYHHYVSTE